MANFIAYLTESDSFFAFYASNLRGSLFSGFLTLSGFLFAVKTFLVVRLQQDVYADEEYQDWVMNIGAKYNKTITVYGSLRRLGRWLFLTLCAGFIAGISQLTIGLIDQRWATWTALSLAVIAAFMFCVTLVIVRSVLRAWVDYLEDKVNKRFEKKSKEQGKESPLASA